MTFSPMADDTDIFQLGSQRVGLLSGLPTLVSDYGVSPDALAAKAGVRLEDLLDQDASIPFPAMGRLFAAARDLTQREDIGLLLGHRTDTLESLGLVGRLMRHAPSLGAALEDLATHQQRYVTGAVIYLFRTEDEAHLGYAVHHKAVDAHALIVDAAMAAGANLLRALGGGLALEIQISRPLPPHPGPWRQLLGVPVRFNAPQSALVIDARNLARPVPGANATMRAALERQVAAYWAVSPPDLAAEVTRVLVPNIPWGQGSLEFAAERLGLHPRTLERRLRDAGTTFRRLQNDLRLEIAGRLLRGTHMSVAMIGEALGYGDPSAFVRWFRHATGQTPARWRHLPGPLSPTLARRGKDGAP